ncbi:anaerobic benzoate catabolism transcriptional regulator [Microbacterium oxydans]|uniref:Anaerobic benzoate catabolism transcriptional regulator n=1 Tax=Microbacterium oxydans TaxID=82380 RepID=A0A0F0KS49_9MICO|nr:helix-turn-helix transcriptional regulator [Microbacterium oxydans]KJL22955.1 anaerobic benzoate catabolism transcriptional regulator [Microbacterium oxydans]
MVDTERSSALAHVIKTFRTEHVKMSRKELAKRSGVNESTIQKIEDGRSPNPGIFTIAAIAVELGLDVTDLLRRRTGPLRPQSLPRPAAPKSADDS